MNEDYLWDKSGEPDPHIQELEELLAPLRYQPKPLELPQQLPVVRRRNYFPLLAIAATVLVALLATGLWLRARTEKAEPKHEAKSAPSVPSVKEEVVENETAPPVKPTPKKINRPRSNQTFAQKQQHEEAVAAKEQVMLALRLASEKLKLAQRITQGASPNQIKNQHKVG
jgi:FtsZ-interacting cell division protein ZipA